MMNNKGFMMAEVIVVSAVILVTLVGLYTSYNKIFSVYNQRVDYYDVTTLYKLANIRDNYLYPENVGEKKVEGGNIVYYVNKNSVKNKTINTNGLNPTFKDYLNYLSTSLDFNSMIIGNKVIKNMLIMESCIDTDNCKYAYLEVLDDDSVLVPECSLSVSGTTITASVNRDDGVKYVGWDTNRVSDNGVMTKTVNQTGTYTFSIEDIDGYVGTCSLSVSGTSAEEVCTGGYSKCRNGGCQCVKTNNSYLKASGICYCKENTSQLRVQSVCTWSNACDCPSGTYTSDTANCSVTCTSGSYSGGNCYFYKGFDYSYNCPSGYTKINDSYCYKLN